MFPVSQDLPPALAAANAEPGAGGKSFLFDFKRGDFVLRDGRVAVPDDEAAIRVWIEKILRTEKGRTPIYYGTRYGIQLEDLLVGGSFPAAFVESELKREIEEALTQHAKIQGISNMAVDRTTGKVAASFTVDLVGGGSVEGGVTYG